MKFRFLQRVILPVLLLCLMACGGNNSALTSGGAGLLFVTAQSNTTVSAFTVDLSNGSLSANGNSVGTGAVPSAIVVTPTTGVVFVANSGSNSISSYTVNGDGSLTAASATAPTGTTPMGLAIDPAGKFLFVANQKSSSISVFSINGTTLTAVPGSPFTTIPVGLSYPNGTLPAAVAVSNSGNFLYVANQLANFVEAFSISSTGALAPLGVPFYNVGISPSGLGIPPNGGFLYVMNAGANSNNVSVFGICDNVVTSCPNPSSPDGTLTEVTGSPFPAGLGPVAITFDPNFNFAYVLDEGSSTVSQYSYGAGSGVLTPLSPATISTGLTPVSIALRVGTTGTNIGNTTTNPTDWVYVANLGASTISIYTLTTTTGLLNVSGMPFTTFGQTSALAVR
jgi:6-phosphogluconolactonase